MISLKNPKIKKIKIICDKKITAIDKSKKIIIIIFKKKFIN